MPHSSNSKLHNMRNRRVPADVRCMFFLLFYEIDVKKSREIGSVEVLSLGLRPYDSAHRTQDQTSSSVQEWGISPWALLY